MLALMMRVDKYTQAWPECVDGVSRLAHPVDDEVWILTGEM